jgi:hypothetical protein
MTTNDFSSQFDVLLNSYTVAARFGSTDNPGTIELDEYEKSLLLTKSQEDLTIELYTGRNSMGTSFEETEEMRRYLSKIVKEAKLEPITTSSDKPLGIDSNSKFFTLPADLWFITYESVWVSDGKCKSMKTMDVYPVTQDEYHKIKRNPFRGANDRRALRLDLSDGVIEIVSKYTVTEYYLRYLRRLQPIILTNLGNDQDIEGVNTVSECELPETLHQRILDRAVQLALQSRGYIREQNNNRE